MADKTDMNALLRASRGIVVKEGEEEKKADDMNALIRAGFGVRAESDDEDD